MIYILRIDRVLIVLFYILIYYILRYRKKIVDHNIAIIVPKSSAAERKAVARRYYHHLSELFFETIWAYTATVEEIQSKINFKDFDKIHAIAESGRNACLLISHIGNWELFCQWAPLVHPKVNCVVLYTDVKAGLLNDYMLKLRQRTGAILVSTKSMLELFRLQKTKNVCVNLFAIDQNPGDPYNQYWMNFFDTKMVPVISGAEKFALSQKQDAYFLWVEKRNGIYELELKEVPYDPSIPYDLTHQQIRLLEENIQLNPALWLLSHNRFKHAEGKKEG